MGSELVLFWLLSASFGIEFKFFTQHYPSSTPHKSSYLRQIYQVFSADAQRLYAASNDHCIATELFASVHAVLQDYLLRGVSSANCRSNTSGGSTASNTSNARVPSPVEALQTILRTTVHTVQAYHQKQPTVGMAQAYLSLLGTYGEYYLHEGAKGRAVRPVTSFLLFISSHMFIYHAQRNQCFCRIWMRSPGAKKLYRA